MNRMTERSIYVATLGDAVFLPLCRWDGRMGLTTGFWLQIHRGKVTKITEEEYLKLSKNDGFKAGPTLLYPRDQMILTDFLQDRDYNLHGGVAHVYAVNNTEAPS